MNPQIHCQHKNNNNEPPTKEVPTGGINEESISVSG